MLWLRRRGTHRWDCFGGIHRVTTPELFLRPPLPGEATEFYGLIDETVAETSGWATDWRLSDETIEALDQSTPGNGWPWTGPNHFAIVQRNLGRGGRGDRLAGSISLELIDGETDVAETGFWLGAAFRGHGLAAVAIDAVTRFAFAHLGMTGVRAETSRTNTASIRSIERAGFVPVGQNRRTLPNGSVVESLRFERRTATATPTPSRCVQPTPSVVDAAFVRLRSRR